MLDVRQTIFVWLFVSIPIIASWAMVVITGMIPIFSDNLPPSASIPLIAIEVVVALIVTIQLIRAVVIFYQDNL